MTWPGINVEVSHSLSQEAAWGRVLGCLNSPRTKPIWGAVSVELLKAELDAKAYRVAASIKVTALAREFTHTLTFQVQPGKVLVTSDKPDELFEGPEMAMEEREIQSMLAEALK